MWDTMSAPSGKGGAQRRVMGFPKNLAKRQNLTVL